MSIADEVKDIKAILDTGAEDASGLLQRFKGYTASENRGKVEGLLNEFLNILAARGAQSELLEGFELLVSWHGEDRAWKKTMARRMLELFKDMRELRVMAGQIQIDKPIMRPCDCLGRLKNLLKLKPEALVYDRNWGVGRVRGLLLHEAQVEVDYAGKPGHLMALSFAAEALESVTEKHLMARKFLEPEALEALVKDQPGEVIKIALRSFGPKSITILQGILCPSIVKDAGWKGFWEAARKSLKADPLVIIPTKRNDPIQLLEKAVDYGTEWFAELVEKRNMGEILSLIETYLANRTSNELPDGGTGAVANRLAFVVKGAGVKQYSLTVRALLLARELGLASEDVGATDFIERLFNPRVLLEFMAGLQARDIKGLFELLPDIDSERALSTMLEALSEMPYGALVEAVDILAAAGRITQVQAALSHPWNLWEAEGDVLYWFATHPEKIREWNLGSSMDLAARLLKVVHREYNGDRLRIQNQIKELFRDPSWLRPLLETMDERQQRTFTQSIKEATAWERLDKNSVLGQIVKISPAMGDIVSGKGAAGSDEARARGSITSIRSYREKERQLRKLVSKDIPENSREIAVARSYGDLRENFEFKAAKDMQGLLMQRKGDMERALQTVTPSNFEGVATDKVGVGTGMRIRFDDGSEQFYYILGEWDGDPELRIISSGSALARSVEGLSVGDTTTAPSESGPRPCTVVEITPLSDEVRAWVEGPPEEEATASDPNAIVPPHETGSPNASGGTH